jgi:hypothetical protein
VIAQATLRKSFLGIAVCILSTAATASAEPAQVLSVDWKLYGAAAVDGSDLCFYDAKGVVQKTDGHIRVWTKCLSIKDMNSIDIKTDFDGKILENTVEQLYHHYVPPYATIETTDFDQAEDIILSEEKANIGNVAPVSHILLELNCSERMMRELSISIHTTDGKSGSTDEPTNWKYVAPETNGMRLLQLLCQSP